MLPLTVWPQWYNNIWWEHKNSNNHMFLHNCCLSVISSTLTTFQTIQGQLYLMLRKTTLPIKRNRQVNKIHCQLPDECLILAHFCTHNSGKQSHWVNSASMKWQSKQLKILPILFSPLYINSVVLHCVLIQRVKLVPWDDLLYESDLKRVLEDVDRKTIL